MALYIVIDWFVDGYSIYPFLSLDHSLASIFLLGLFFLRAVVQTLVWVSTIKMNQYSIGEALVQKSILNGELDRDNLILK